MFFSRNIFLISSFGVAFFTSPMGYTQDTIGSSVDCTDVSVNYSDNAELTREERLELMNKALLSSLNKFELCQSERNANSASAASGSDGNAGGGGQGSGGDNAGESAALEGGSVASSGISGTEAPKTTKNADAMTDPGSGATSANGQKLDHASGKLPEDIPEAANDDALAAQIRYAAENESDPVKKARLWDEYRKYKGIPVKQ